MFRKFTVGTKITLLVSSLIVLSVLALSVIALKVSRESIQERSLQSLNVVADLKVQRIESFFEKTSSEIALIQQLPVVKNNLAEAQQALDSSNTEAYDQLKEKLNSTLLPLKSTYKLENLYLTDKAGKIIYNAESASEHDNPGEFLSDPDGYTLKVNDSIHFSNIYRLNDSYFLMASAPMTDDNGNNIGLVVCQINMAPVYAMIQDTTGLGATGETIIGKLYDNKVIFQNPLRHDKNAALKKVVYIGESTNKSIQEAASKKEGYSIAEDYRKKETLSTWRHIGVVNWGIVVKMDTEEIFASVNRLVITFSVVAFVIVIISLILAVIFSRVLTNPLVNLKETMLLLGKGILPNRINHKAADEIGQMTATVNNLVEGLKRTADFAYKIGDGHFDADYKPMSEDDALGLALIGMRNSLQDAAKNDDERNWIIRGVAEIGEILRRHSEIDTLGDEIIAFITNKIGAIQGAFYIAEKPESGRPIIEMKASYAYNKKKHLQSRFRFGEGLVGQAAIEQDTIIRTEIPDSYVTITSGLLGDKKPKCMLIVPLITNEEVNGALEFAGFTKFSPMQVKFVQEVSQIIARTLFNIQVNERTRQLLTASQKMSMELQQQQEELRQNAEEMEATQEELKRSNAQLEIQIEEVERTQIRMQTLLQNASEVITIYEKDFTIRYISPSVEKILGYRAEEMVGINDIIHVHSEGVKVVEKMFADLLENPFQQVTTQFSYKRKDGQDLWLEATGKNLLSDPAIKGIVINSRDITERRLAEKEARMRGQMQALSENSPDLITRVNKEGTFFYINPIIEEYTGLKPDYFLQKSLLDVEVTNSLKDAWFKIIDEVTAKQDKVASEIDFESDMGNRVMQVNAIPEYNEEESMESILLVSHDITERKQIELEIQSKNKKITESINYAKRIQEAILPDNDLIQTVFPDSFILYKPRDVVSGDFPWFMQKDDDIFIAAVDCTGHGVPGALISLIGYFLLNDIVGSQGISEPGRILDLLDEGVTRTLKQSGADSASRDGMDVAFCKINKKTGVVEYAGAHRPLYYLRNGELNEIKGDKFPIGGGQYKNRVNFTNTVIEYQPGDTIVFCSDGFPDQFGGADNRKFGPKRIREILTENASENMQAINNIYDEKFEEWKGDGKQTDDVLMIGIRF
jgi:PAS domain S-box-containing protein